MSYADLKKKKKVAPGNIGNKIAKRILCGSAIAIGLALGYFCFRTLWNNQTFANEFYLREFLGFKFGERCSFGDGTLKEPWYDFSEVSLTGCRGLLMSLELHRNIIVANYDEARTLAKLLEEKYGIAFQEILMGRHLFLEYNGPKTRIKILQYSIDGDYRFRLSLEITDTKLWEECREKEEERRLRRIERDMERM